MNQNLIFIQIGCGFTANYMGLLNDDWYTEFDLPGIEKTSRWRGMLVDLQPASILELIRQFGGNPRIDIVNAAVAGDFRVIPVETRKPFELDQETRLINASKYNDKPRPDFQIAYYTHTIPLSNLLQLANTDADTSIGLLAMDVQGSEVDIFRNYDWSVYPEFIDVECHSQDALAIVSTILVDRGYSCVAQRPDGRKRVNHLWQRQN